MSSRLNWFAKWCIVKVKVIATRSCKMFVDCSLLTKNCPYFLLSNKINGLKLFWSALMQKFRCLCWVFFLPSNKAGKIRKVGNVFFRIHHQAKCLCRIPSAALIQIVTPLYRFCGSSSFILCICALSLWPFCGSPPCALTNCSCSQLLSLSASLLFYNVIVCSALCIYTFQQSISQSQV